MNRMTFNLIMVAKNAQFGKAKEYVSGTSPLERIKSYMAHFSGLDADDIDNLSLRSIFMDALSDYVNTCDNPGAFMYQLEMHGVLRSARYEASYKDTDPNKIYNDYASAFMLIQVKDIDVDKKEHYVNGFHEDYFKEWKDEYEW